MVSESPSLRIRGIGFGQVLDPRSPLEHLGQVVLPFQKVGPFQPRHRGPHAGVVGGIAPLEHLRHLLVADQFLGGDDHLVVRVGLAAPQAFEDALDLLFFDFRVGPQFELGFGIFRIVKQDAIRRLTVASGPAPLLQVVLQ